MAIFEGGREEWDYRLLLIDALALLFAGINCVMWPLIFVALMINGLP